MAVIDRLALARRAYLDANLAANAVYAAEVQPAYALWGTAANEARQRGPKERIPDDVVAEYQNQLHAAGEKRRAAVADAEAEVTEAVAEAKQAGTFHWLVATFPAPAPAQFDELPESGEGWLDEWEL